MSSESLNLDKNNIPKHVAIIMDGNRRWAKQNFLPSIEGHRQGLERVKELLDVCEEIGVSILTLYAFSTENWKRSNIEVKGLMELFKFFFKREFKALKKKNIKIIHSGIKSLFSKDIQNIIDQMTYETKHNTNGILNLAINYSGRLEIIEAIKQLSKDLSNNKLDINNITEETFSKLLFHPELPDPDLLIRTSGEKRISNFLLWQIAYTELYFTDILWPNFTKQDFINAILEYQKRERRFGAHI